jgi:WD40 repeat protein
MVKRSLWLMRKKAAFSECGMLRHGRKKTIQGLFPQIDDVVCGHLLTVTYSPDGKLLALGGGHYKPKEYSVKLWDLSSEKVIRVIKGHSDTIMAVVFTPEGKKLITASADHTIKIWEVESGKQIASWVAHDSVIRDLAISPSGKLLVSCGGDHFARVWDLEKILERK